MYNFSSSFIDTELVSVMVVRLVTLGEVGYNKANGKACD